MKLVTYRHHGLSGVGMLDELTQRIVPLDNEHGDPVVDMLGLIRDGLAHASPSVMRDPLALVEVELLAPIPRPLRNIFCIGKNYARHAEEFARSGFDDQQAQAGAPIVFTKVPETVIGDGDMIEYPFGLTDALDYEAELAVVIGTGGRSISKARALEHVFGYTIINDVTARDIQQRHQQWFMGKSMDTFCPMGPCLVTADELDATDLELRCHVNGQLRQLGNTSDLIFDIAALIVSLSSHMTLYPGDIIATGTPEGVGAGFNPPRFLQSGDHVCIQIAGIGELNNTVS